MKVCSIVTTMLLAVSMAFAAETCPPRPSAQVQQTQVCPPGTTATTVSQVCPTPVAGSVCLVPSSSVATYNVASAGTVPVTTFGSTSCPMIVSSTGTVAQPIAACPTGMVPVTGTYAQPIAACPTGMVPVTGTYAQPIAACPPGMVPVSSQVTTVGAVGCPSNVSPDTACVLNAIAGLRSDVYFSSLEMRGFQLLSRLNQLQADELMLRNQLAANPNLPGASAMGLRLQNEAIALNNDIAAFNRELAMVPANQRPLLAARLNTFDVVYWQPAMQNFATYRAQFPAGATVYTTAWANTPAMANWSTNYQTSLSNINATSQQYASVRWWTSMPIASTTTTTTMGTMPQVAGSVETLSSACMWMSPSGQSVVLPAGSAVFIPASNVPVLGTVQTSSAPVCVPVQTPTAAAPMQPDTTVAGTTETLPPPAAQPPTTSGTVEGGLW